MYGFVDDSDYAIGFNRTSGYNANWTTSYKRAGKTAVSISGNALKTTIAPTVKNGTEEVSVTVAQHVPYTEGYYEESAMSFTKTATFKLNVSALPVVELTGSQYGVKDNIHNVNLSLSEGGTGLLPGTWNRTWSLSALDNTKASVSFTSGSDSSLGTIAKNGSLNKTYSVTTTYTLASNPAKYRSYTKSHTVTYYNAPSVTPSTTDTYVTCVGNGAHDFSITRNDGFPTGWTVEWFDNNSKSLGKNDAITLPLSTDISVASQSLTYTAVVSNKMGGEIWYSASIPFHVELYKRPSASATFDTKSYDHYYGNNDVFSVNVDGGYATAGSWTYQWTKNGSVDGSASSYTANRSNSNQGASSTVDSYIVTVKNTYNGNVWYEKKFTATVNWWSKGAAQMTATKDFLYGDNSSTYASTTLQASRSGGYTSGWTYTWQNASNGSLVSQSAKMDASSFSNAIKAFTYNGSSPASVTLNLVAKNKISDTEVGNTITIPYTFTIYPKASDQINFTNGQSLNRYYGNADNLSVTTSGGNTETGGWNFLWSTNASSFDNMTNVSTDNVSSQYQFALSSKSNTATSTSLTRYLTVSTGKNGEVWYKKTYSQPVVAWSKGDTLAAITKAYLYGDGTPCNGITYNSSTMGQSTSGGYNLGWNFSWSTVDGSSYCGQNISDSKTGSFNTISAVNTTSEVKTVTLKLTATNKIDDAHVGNSFVRLIKFNVYPKAVDHIDFTNNETIHRYYGDADTYLVDVSGGNEASGGWTFAWNSLTNGIAQVAKTLHEGTYSSQCTFTSQAEPNATASSSATYTLTVTNRKDGEIWYSKSYSIPVNYYSLGDTLTAVTKPYLYGDATPCNGQTFNSATIGQSATGGYPQGWTYSWENLEETAYVAQSVTKYANKTENKLTATNTSGVVKKVKIRLTASNKIDNGHIGNTFKRDFVIDVYPKADGVVDFADGQQVNRYYGNSDTYSVTTSGGNSSVGGWNFDWTTNNSTIDSFVNGTETAVSSKCTYQAKTSSASATSKSIVRTLTISNKKGDEVWYTKSFTVPVTLWSMGDTLVATSKDFLYGDATPCNGQTFNTTQLSQSVSGGYTQGWTLNWETVSGGTYCSQSVSRVNNSTFNDVTAFNTSNDKKTVTLRLTASNKIDNDHIGNTYVRLFTFDVYPKASDEIGFPDGSTINRYYGNSDTYDVVTKGGNVDNGGWTYSWNTDASNFDTKYRVASDNFSSTYRFTLNTKSASATSSSLIRSLTVSTGKDNEIWYSKSYSQNVVAWSKGDTLTAQAKPFLYGDATPCNGQTFNSTTLAQSTAGGFPTGWTFTWEDLSNETFVTQQKTNDASSYRNTLKATNATSETRTVKLRLTASNKIDDEHVGNSYQRTYVVDVYPKAEATVDFESGVSINRYYGNKDTYTVSTVGGNKSNNGWSFVWKTNGTYDNASLKSSSNTSSTYTYSASTRGLSAASTSATRTVSIQTGKDNEVWYTNSFNVPVTFWSLGDTLTAVRKAFLYGASTICNGETHNSTVLSESTAGGYNQGWNFKWTVPTGSDYVSTEPSATNIYTSAVTNKIVATNNTGEVKPVVLKLEVENIIDANHKGSHFVLSFPMNIYPKATVPTQISDWTRQLRDIDVNTFAVTDGLYGDADNWTYDWSEDNVSYQISDKSITTREHFINKTVKSQEDHNVTVRWNNSHEDEVWEAGSFDYPYTVYNTPAKPDAMVTKGNGVSNIYFADMSSTTLSDAELFNDTYDYIFDFGDGNNSVVIASEDTQRWYQYTSRPSAPWVRSRWTYSDGFECVSDIRDHSNTRGETGLNTVNSTSDANSIRVLTMDGKQVRVVDGESVQWNLQALDLEPGMYIVKIQRDGHSVSRKIMVK